MIQHIKIIIALFLIGQTTLLFAQENTLDKEVKVVKPYDPTISDAFKINILPQIIDTLQINPSFDYSIESKQIKTEFKVEPIKPATMVGEPLNKIYKSYIKGAIGNYYSPMLEVYYNSLRSKETAYGIIAKHQSSHGSIKNVNGDKVYAGFSDNLIDLFGKKFYPNEILYGGLSFSRNTTYFYGLDKQVLGSTFFDAGGLEKEDLTNQRFSTLTGNVGYKTNYVDTALINYNANLKYNYFNDRYENSENSFNFKAAGSTIFNTEYLGANLDFDYYNHNSLSDTINTIYTQLNPWIGRFGKQFKVKLGLNAALVSANSDTKYYFYPNVYLDYKIVDNFIIPYIGYEGNYQVNNFMRMANENAFIRPNLVTEGTNNKMKIFLGIKGNMSSRMSYNIQGMYRQVDNMHFFVNRKVGVNVFETSTDTLQNFFAWKDFEVVYDDVRIISFNGDISYAQSEKLNLVLKGEYLQYTMDKELKPWHMPEYKFSLTANYNLREKIVLNVDLFSLSNRYAKTYNLLTGKEGVKELGNVVDANLGIEYRYTKLLSAFININNIAAQRYYKWNNYPMQGFNVMLGLSYSL